MFITGASSGFGTLDVVIKNAGYGAMGTVEEVGEQATRDIFEVNVLASIWVIRAALPLMRAQGSGHIIPLSSLLGVVGVLTVGIYSATKFAVEGFCEALTNEVIAFCPDDWGHPTPRYRRCCTCWPATTRLSACSWVRSVTPPFNTVRCPAGRVERVARRIGGGAPLSERLFCPDNKGRPLGGLLLFNLFCYCTCS